MLVKEASGDIPHDHALIVDITIGVSSALLNEYSFVGGVECSSVVLS